MKRKYADMYYSVKNTDKGWMWKIFFNYADKEPSQTSLDNEDDDDKYAKTETAARQDAIEAIQDHYS
jgi:hypothetical protein